jgi:hypothetical protein
MIIKKLLRVLNNLLLLLCNWPLAGEFGTLINKELNYYYYYYYYLLLLLLLHGTESILRS